MTKHDRIYQQPKDRLEPFAFNEAVVEVFTDMVTRSVPGYTDMLWGIGALAKLSLPQGARVYDLGCSLGAATAAVLATSADRSPHCICVDLSPAMLAKAKDELGRQFDGARLSFVEDDVRDQEINQADLIILNLTLQFITDPVDRTALIKKCHDGLRSGGHLVLSEKLYFDDPRQHEAIKALHEEFKKSQGYSTLEVAQKRDALVNVLVPETVDQHLKRLRGAGFDQAFVWLQNLSFVSMLAIKA